jgi:hypothetical protein
MAGKMPALLACGQIQNYYCPAPTRWLKFGPGIRRLEKGNLSLASDVR